MDFICYKCDSRFKSEKAAIDHLKKTHGIREKVDLFQCLLNFQYCKTSFQSVQGLKKHHKTCALKVRV